MPVRYTVKYREVLRLDKPWYPNAGPDELFPVAVTSVKRDEWTILQIQM